MNRNFFRLLATKIVSRCKNRFRRLYNALRLSKIGGISPLWVYCHLHIYCKDYRIDIRTRNIGDVHIYMYGNGHHLIIEDGVIYKRGIIWFEDNNCQITIGKNTTIEEAHLSAAEDNMKLSVGEDCMLSHGIYISTTDSHSIISLKSGKRTNKPAEVYIGRHVWIGRNVTINKGVLVGENSVIASNSVVTNEVPQNAIVAGVPARVVKTDITWDRNRL